MHGAGPNPARSPVTRTPSPTDCTHEMPLKNAAPQRPTDRKKTTGLADRPAISAPARPGFAGSVRDCAIDLNFAISASPSDNSIARRQAAMTPTTSLHLGHLDRFGLRVIEAVYPVTS